MMKESPGVKGMPLGDYYVTEVQAPEGYVLDTESKKSNGDRERQG